MNVGGGEDEKENNKPFADAEDGVRLVRFDTDEEGPCNGDIMRFWNGRL